jgi:hypothetical protein
VTFGSNYRVVRGRFVFNRKTRVSSLGDSGHSRVRDLGTGLSRALTSVLIARELE